MASLGALGDKAGPWLAQAFWVPRRGHQPEEYEDAWAVDERRGRFAIADGATESSFAGEWARLLTSDFTLHAQAEPATWLGRLAELQGQWWKEVADRPLAWYAEEKRALGAFATLLGLMLGSDGAWRALAIGDSCLFHVRDGVPLTCFPIADAGEFGNNPWLLGSRRPLTPEWQKQAVQVHTGEWRPADQFWLLTDAVAHWLLQTVTAEAAKPILLPFEPTAAAFAEWVDAQRETGTLRNDDCTWLVIETE